MSIKKYIFTIFLCLATSLLAVKQAGMHCNDENAGLSSRQNHCPKNLQQIFTGLHSRDLELDKKGQKLTSSSSIPTRKTPPSVLYMPRIFSRPASPVMQENTNGDIV